MNGEGAETNRGRVRRILIQPLREAGMRLSRRKGEPPAGLADRERRFLDQLCDDLGYCTEPTLRAVLAWAKVSGEGQGRCYWPARVGFLQSAQRIQPLPLEELPELASWFGSRAGPEAQAAGRILGEFLFIQKYRRPPVSDDERRTVGLRGAELADEQMRLRDRADTGRADTSDRARLGWLDDVERRAVDLIEAGEAKRAERATA
ncbi:hypothetical protein [Chachezhania antarctica]|uniref:hypothetical protein n=1 Tax=Chachezhania antarctica TaxID=2340860 RepID=UPI000EB2C142|nr:hypothetical protein [Chachezhania antarctica]|tara:strand:+ start:1354 stop:1968 length:615 start_codon:yes stop_codon:yes gene_type:complete